MGKQAGLPTRFPAAASRAILLEGAADAPGSGRVSVAGTAEAEAFPTNQRHWGALPSVEMHRPPQGSTGDSEPSVHGASSAS